jgi:hypothetical protein
LLGSQFLGLGLLKLGDLGQGLVAQAGASPVLADLFGPLVEVGLHGLDQLVQGTLILGLDLEKQSKLLSAIASDLN